ncbi:MAG TPA: hypothetical protein VK152_06435 [Paludibacter sp.]|nr:hypothetical protein [Paludibacter sp.]
MNGLAKFIIVLYGLSFIVLFILLVYLVIKRIKNRGKEDFEKRDN